MSRSKYNTNKKAFLSLDLLAALSITALLISISLPGLSEMLYSLKLKKEALKINSLLERQISSASSKSENYLITLEKSGLYVTKNSTPADLVKAITLSKNYFINFTATNKTIHINKQNTCSPAGFEIINGNKKCKISISLRCRIALNCA